MVYNSKCQHSSKFPTLELESFVKETMYWVLWLDVKLLQMWMNFIRLYLLYISKMSKFFEISSGASDVIRENQELWTPATILTNKQINKQTNK